MSLSARNHQLRASFLFFRIALITLSMSIATGSSPVLAFDAEDDDPSEALFLRGDQTCTGCHDEGGESVLAIGKTMHGTNADNLAPTCTSCHGRSRAHINSPDKVPMPARTFARNSRNSIEDRNSACLNCHLGGKRMHWTSSTHANRDVACTACHQIHADRDKVRDRNLQAEVCFSCHKEQRAQINRPSRHPIREGKVICSDCHNPHGSAGPSKMLKDSVNDTCYTCHMEKRGPFVRNHPPVQENCALCHNAHGTTAPNLLRVRSPFLCQECHEPNTHHGSPGTIDGAYRRNLLARGCLNCHTQIHGSNNPENFRLEDLFQR